MNKLVNWKQFNEYQHIFGTDKMNFLWREYMQQAQEQWQNLPGEFCESLRLIFHSWKSSSQVFGLDEFARRCAVLEDNILNKRHADRLPQQIDDCRDCFDKSVAELIPYFEKWKKSHD